MPQLALFLLLLGVATATVAASPPLPDLELDKNHLANSVVVTETDISDTCLVDAGCAPSTGVHMLLRFATRAQNTAPPGSDIVIGPPPPAPPLSENSHFIQSKTAKGLTWEWHPCHGHWHLAGFALAELLDGDTLQPIGPATAKHSFCFRDSACPRAGVEPKFTCDNQGIQAGCHDTYGVHTPCQFVVVDGLPLDKEYVLRVTLDPDNLIPESNETNNRGEVRVRLGEIFSAAESVHGSARAAVLFLLLGLCVFAL
jgi:hypothetical protein